MKNVVLRRKSFPRLHFVRFDLDFLLASRCNAFFFVYEILRLYLTAFFIYSSFSSISIYYSKESYSIMYRNSYILCKSDTEEFSGSRVQQTGNVSSAALLKRRKSMNVNAEV